LAASYEWGVRRLEQLKQLDQRSEPARASQMGMR
jgi:hypothetical protein